MYFIRATTSVDRRLWITCPAETVVTADLGSIDETKQLASKMNAFGKFDVVIHNAGVYQASAEEIFNVNTLAPYILTCLIQIPKRLIYLSSGMHLDGRSKLETFKKDVSRITYSDSKVHVLMLCIAVARKWPEVYANAVDPGWVPTKMGGQMHLMIYKKDTRRRYGLL